MSKRQPRKPKPDADDARVDVTLSAREARRVVEALRRRGLHAHADHIASEAGAAPDDLEITLWPKIRTAAEIANVCATEGVGAGNRFSMAASYGRYREAAEAKATTEY